MSKRPIPAEPEPSESKERIIEGAIKVFSERSVEAASVQMIADEAGVTKSLLMYHFQSKENLYQIVLDRIYGMFIRRFDHIFEQLESTKKLQRPEAIEILREMIDIQVEGFCRDLPALKWKGRIFLYEYVYPSDHYGLFYEKRIKKQYEAWIKVIMAITGNQDRKTAYFQAVSIFGQTIGFRLQRELLRRSLNIDTLSQDDLETIKTMVIGSTFFLLGVKQ